MAGIVIGRKSFWSGVAGAHVRQRMGERFLDPDAFVFLDETGADTKMTRRTGWAPLGKRAVEGRIGAQSS